jgi:type I restriction-modification system DNA methylase subunit
MRPQPKDVVCDPAGGTCGFLVAGEYLRQHNPELFRDLELNQHFHHNLFHGFDFDNTMLRIGSMNMLTPKPTHSSSPILPSRARSITKAPRSAETRDKI